MEIIFVFFIGTVFGSFINATAFRLVRKKDFVFERSCCPDCLRQLSFLDMVPIISYLVKQGKCTYCEKKISVRYFFTEVLGGINAVVCFLLSKTVEIKIYYFIILNLLLLMALIDIEIKEIEDIYQVLILIVTIIIVLREGFSIDNLLAMFIISVPLLMVLLLTESIGGADVKLFFTLGLLTKTKGIIIIYLLTIAFAGIFGLYRLIKERNMKEEIPLIPFIYFSFLIYSFFEKSFLKWLQFWLT